MKKLILLFTIIGFSAFGQCTGVPTSGGNKAYKTVSCYDTVKVASYLNTVVADTVTITKLTVTGTLSATISPTISSNGTDANYTAVVNTIKYLPASTLTTARTITIPAGSDGDFMEIYNNESAFAWNLGGSTVYLADRTTVVTVLQYDYPTFIKKISGKWIITN